MSRDFPSARGKIILRRDIATSAPDTCHQNDGNALRLIERNYAFLSLIKYIEGDLSFSLFFPNRSL